MRKIRRRHSLTMAWVLMVVVVVFSSGRHIEVAHPIEETTAHTDHHNHEGRSVDTIPTCDTDEHSHACLHTQNLVVATCYAVANGIGSISGPQIQIPNSPSVPSRLQETLRGPPLV